MWPKILSISDCGNEGTYHATRAILLYLSAKNVKLGGKWPRILSILDSGNYGTYKGYFTIFL
jgi:hypothetical protein